MTAIVHVDLDAFFASVEVLDDPSLAGKPVIVGGTGRRGVVAACTYEARCFGVHSAMPSMRARALCPHAVFLPGRYPRYSEMSARFHDVLHRVTPIVEPLALDEAFLDVTGAQRLFGEPRDIAARIRADVRAELGLDASVGVAATKFIAKLASEAAKPKASRAGITPGAGVVVIDPGSELAFLHPLPVRALWGVGPATLARLARFGVETVGDLAALPAATLVSALGPSAGQHLHDLAWGRDPRPVEPERAVKSVSHEETYAEDLYERAELEREALRLADGVSGRLRRSGLAARTIGVKVRYHDFSTISRSVTGPPVDTGSAIAHLAVELLSTVETSPGVRLLGVVASNLVDGGARQLSLDEGWGAAAEAVDRVRARFGESAVVPAALVGRGIRRTGSAPWGPGSR
ncbi:MAG TPA: DNA polymerase IV [Acidimicrobiales bacterium]|nr:DNA polymerase IV [Acidimicrobiales bacterium]